MSDTTTPAATVPTPVAEPVPTPLARSGGLEVTAHLLAALLIGSVAPVLVRLTSPAYDFGVVPGGFELVEIAPQLVAVVSLGLALLVRALRAGWLRDIGWIVAAAGLGGLAGLYAQGTTLDGLTLTILLVVVISLQIVGLLLAFARAGGPARWAVATGLAAGVAGGREALALVVSAVRSGPLQGSLHGDDIVLGAAALLVAVAGFVVLVLSRGERAYPEPAESFPSAWWSHVRWPLVAVVVSSVIAVVLTRVWNARIDDIAQSFIGGISESDARSVQSTDQVYRVLTALVITALLVAAAQLWGGANVVRWVLVAFGTGVLLVGLEGFLAPEATWLSALLGVAGVVAGVLAVRYADRVMPWDALGLLLATGLLLDFAGAGLVGAFGLGLAVTAGVLRLAPARLDGASRRLGPGGVTVAAALGLAAWVLVHQVVVPSASFYRADLGGVPILPYGVGVAAVAGIGFFLIDRKRPN